MKISDFEEKRPTFRLEEFFTGRVQGWGVTLSRFEVLQNQFKIEAVGSWDVVANTLAIKEIYTFDDGHVDELTWSILKKDDRSYEGRETRIGGLADGTQAGNAFRWSYTRDVPAANGTSANISFDDWFWLQDAETMIAHASLSKLGVEISTLNAFYRKVT